MTVCASRRERDNIFSVPEKAYRIFTSSLNNLTHRWSLKNSMSSDKQILGVFQTGHLQCLMLNWEQKRVNSKNNKKTPHIINLYNCHERRCCYTFFFTEQRNRTWFPVENLQSCSAALWEAHRRWRETAGSFHPETRFRICQRVCGAQTDTRKLVEPLEIIRDLQVGWRDQSL